MVLKISPNGIKKLETIIKSQWKGYPVKCHLNKNQIQMKCLK